jgi:hypothetical protein
MGLYARMTQKYIKERNSIPDGNLVEVRYGDMITHPFQQLKNVYKTIGLDGFLDAETMFRTYLSSQQGIKTDRYAMTDKLQQKIERNWGFAIKEFKYDHHM